MKALLMDAIWSCFLGILIPLVLYIGAPLIVKSEGLLPAQPHVEKLKLFALWVAAYFAIKALSSLQTRRSGLSLKWLIPSILLCMPFLYLWSTLLDKYTLELDLFLMTVCTSIVVFGPTFTIAFVGTYTIFKSKASQSI